MPRMIICLQTILFLFALTFYGCGATGSKGSESSRQVSTYLAFSGPERVAIHGYGGDAMEPFITRDGRYLLFNNLNDPAVNTDLHYAERVNEVTFVYRGEVRGVNTMALEGVPTMDRNGNLYFVSLRSYNKTFSTIYSGRFSGGIVTGIDLVSSISKEKPVIISSDVEVSPDGRTLYFVDGVFRGNAIPLSADIIIAVRRMSGFERLERSGELLKNVNTDALEYAACISADGLELFFTRLDKRKKSPAIFRATRKTATEPFARPECVSVIQGYAEAPALSPDEQSLYYYKRQGKRFVIYRVTRQ